MGDARMRRIVRKMHLVQVALSLLAYDLPAGCLPSSSAACAAAASDWHKQHDKRSVESPRLELYKRMMCLQLFKESMLARAAQRPVQDAWRRKQCVCPPRV